MYVYILDMRRVYKFTNIILFDIDSCLRRKDKYLTEESEISKIIPTL